MNPENIVFSVLTPAGRAAVAVIALHGPDVHAALSRRILVKTSGNGLSLARFIDTAGSFADEVILRCIADAALEIHCHGGTAAASSISETLRSAGITEITPAEMLLRRHKAGLCNAVETEALLLLSSGVSPGVASLVLRSAAAVTAAALASDRKRLESLLAASPPMLRFCRTHRLAIGGPENSGKSALANALGSNSLVSDAPGTTRDTVKRFVEWDGAMLQILDTAGLAPPARPGAAATLENEDHGLADEARKRALGSLVSADVVLWVSSRDTPALPPPRALAVPIVHVLNKCDRFGSRPGTLNVSALSGEGVADLKKTVLGILLGGDVRPAAFTERQADVIAKILAGSATTSELLDETGTEGRP